MGLKPSPRTAVLVQESVEARIRSGGLDHDEYEQLRDFSDDIDRYLVGASL